MYDRNELAEAHFDAPAPCQLGLIDLIIADALQNPDDPAFASLHAAIRTDGVTPDGFAPGDVIEAIGPFLDRDFADRPVGWHLRRTLHRLDHALAPSLRHPVSTDAKKHRAILDRWGAPDAEAFLYSGLTPTRHEPAVTEHLRQHATAGLDVAAFCARAPGGWIERADPDVVAASVASVLAVIGAQGVIEGSGESTLALDHSIPGHALAWLEVAARHRPDFITLVGDRPLPVVVVERYRRPIAMAHGEFFRHDGALHTWEELDRERPDVVIGDPGDIPGRIADFVVAERRVFHLRNVRLPDDPTLALVAIGAVARNNAAAAQAAARWLREVRGQPSDQSIRELAKRAGPVLAAILDQGWSAAIAGADELVPVAATIQDPGARIRALIAIGRPAAKALASEVDRMLAAPPGKRDHRDPQLGRLADEALVLGLPFWEKRLDGPAAFERLWGSERLRLAFTLRSEPVCRLLRRAAAHAETRDRNPGLVILAVLHAHEPRPDLAPVADEVVRLLADDLENRLGWEARFELLAMAGSEAAAAALLTAAGEAPTATVLAAASRSDWTWTVLAASGAVTVQTITTSILDKATSPPPAVALAVMDSLFGDRFTDEPLPATPGLDLPPRVQLAFELLVLHHRRLSDEALKGRLDGLRPYVGDITLEAVRARGEQGQDRDGSPWDRLPDDDLCHMVPELGAWVAAHIDDPAVDVPKLLGRALRAHHGRILGELAPSVMEELGEIWPTQAHLAEAAVRADTTLPAKLLDQCADEALPVVFRAGLRGLPRTIEAEQEARYSDHHWLVRWVFGVAWQHSPELLARHLLPEFVAAADSPWKRGLATTMVALREPVGTKVPGALTEAMHAVAEGEAQEFYRRQRDAFARKHAAQEQQVAVHIRTREAWTRLRRAALAERALTLVKA